MEQRRSLRIAGAALALMVAATGLVFASAEKAQACGAGDDLLGDSTCVHKSLSGQEASLSASQGAASVAGGAHDSSLTGSGNGPKTPPPPPRGPDTVHCIKTVRDPTFPICREADVAVAPPAGTPGVTLADIATFRPAPGTDHMQPDGWTVAGLDTNFYAIAAPQIVPGTLLGRPAEVRFTAVDFRWDYGDGTSAVRRTPGATWEQLRIPEFDPTPTSHDYAVQGDYTVHLVIDYRAEYRFDGPDFVAIAGTITLPTNDLRITVGDATTVLVDHDCAVDPAGPGC